MFDGLPSLRLTTQPNRSARIRIANSQKLKPGTWNHIAVAYDGSRDVSGLALYLNGQTVPFEARADFNPFPGNFRTYVPMRIASDGKKGNFDGGAVSELRIYTRAIVRRRSPAGLGVAGHRSGKKQEDRRTHPDRARRPPTLFPEPRVLGLLRACPATPRAGRGAQSHRAPRRGDARPAGADGPAAIRPRPLSRRCTTSRAPKSSRQFPPRCRRCRRLIRATGWDSPSGWSIRAIR